MSEMIDDIVKNTNGVFVWVKIALVSVGEGLRNCDEYEEIRERLRISPTELKELYRHMISNIPPIYRVGAAKYLRLTMAANENIKLFGLALAVNCTQDSPNHSGIQLSWSCEQTIRYSTTALTRLLARCMGFLELKPVASIEILHA